MTTVCNEVQLNSQLLTNVANRLNEEEQNIQVCTNTDREGINRGCLHLLTEVTVGLKHTKHYSGVADVKIPC